MLEQYQTIILLTTGALGLILFIWNILLQVNLSQLKKKQKILFTGKEAKNLEQIILKNNTRLEGLDKDIKDLYEITAKIHALSFRSLHKVGVLRFNPFRDLGGDQSFSVALLDGKHNGVVISSLYSRDGVRVYAKALTQGESAKYPLTEEERTAIAQATGR